MSGFSSAWDEFRARTDFDEYATRWDRLEADGADVHGEADFIMKLGSEHGPPRSVLDAGCGAGRVARRLHRRSVDVVGADLDADLLARAKARNPSIAWVQCDLAELDLGRTFDCVALVGNVLPYARPQVRAGIIAACARHIEPGGRLIIGANLNPSWPTPSDLVGWMTDGGIDELARFEGWNEEPWPSPDGPEPTYLVMVGVKNPGANDTEAS